MQRPLFEREWHSIRVDILPGTGSGKVAGREFYSSFYGALLADSGRVSDRWVNQKRKIGEWLHGEFMAGAPDPGRAFSVGAGLGVVETQLHAHHHDVDFLECEERSVRHAIARCSGLRGVVGDATHIPFRAARYDLVFMAGVDYCFDRLRYRLVLSEMRRLLQPGGRAVVICFSNLSVRSLVLDMARRALRRPASGILWGYQRSIGEHLACGRQAGLRAEAVYLIDSNFDVRRRRTPGDPRFAFWTMQDYWVAVAFTSA